MEDSSSNQLIWISVERLQQLEELERSLNQRIQEAIVDHKKQNLKLLHDKDKTNPEAVRLRIKRYNMKNKDKINERRREKRKEQRLADITTHPATSVTDIEELPTAARPKAPSPKPRMGMTVRFDD